MQSLVHLELNGVSYTKSRDFIRGSELIKTKSVGRRPTRNQVTMARIGRVELPYIPLPEELVAHVFNAKTRYLDPAH